MKSTIFLSASAIALFASAPTFAQNNISTVNQSGNGANADVGQTGTADNSEVNQSAGAKAKVRQAGTNTLAGRYTPDQYPNNRSLITQSAANADADVAQNGTVNRSTIDQAAAAVSLVRQTGTYNNSTIRQEATATGATAKVTQLGSYGDNRSGIVQRGDSTATVTQTDGASNPPGFQYPGNQSDIDQTGNGNEATVAQNGDDNFSTVTQNATGAVATVVQTGSENNATTTQNATAKSNIEQGNSNPASMRNTAFVTQNAMAGGSISDINQNGTGNRADITQNAANQDSFNYSTGTDNRATVSQNASRNVSVLLQNRYYGGNGSGPSTGNQATVTQAAGSDNSFSYVYQDGRANIAQVNLSGAGVVKARQAGSEGYVEGNGPAESVVLTIGADNKAYVDQAADRSEANIYQGLDGKYALVTPSVG
ncbi:MAG TPA: hypothetical protein VM900_05135, partial [Sphingomonas sp.]|nr:hypothetical protein [Sphingomonas sp.]